MKKLLSILLILCLCLALGACGGGEESIDNADKTPNTPAKNEVAELIAGISAETATAKGLCGADLSWYYKDNILLIKGSGAMNEYESTFAWPWYDYKDDIVKVVIDDGCTGVGAYAFAYYENLSSLHLPTTMKSIGESAFSQTGISELILPEGLEVLANNSFYYCANLTRLHIPATLDAELSEAAFSYCNALSELTFAEGLTAIPFYMFSDCQALTTVTLPQSLTAIGMSAFSGCDALEVTVPASVTEIGNRAFKDCAHLTYHGPAADENGDHWGAAAFN